MHGNITQPPATGALGIPSLNPNSGIVDQPSMDNLLPDDVASTPI